MISNWFTKIESQFILDLLEISIIVKKDVDTSTFFEVAVKCLSVFGTAQKPRIALVLKNIVFNSAFYPPETLMDNVRLQADGGTLKTCLEDICQVYSRCLNLVSFFICT